MRLFRTFPAAFGLFAVALAATPSSAQTVTVGTPTSSICIPFRCAGASGLTEYQEVYAASAFSSLGGPMNLLALTFFTDPSFSGSYSSALFTISLSTTSKAVGGLSPNLASNVGADEAFFGAFTLPSGPAPSQFTLTGTPFYYDRSAGNLLVDIIPSGGSDGAGVFLLSDGTQTVVQRATNLAVNHQALVTEFDFAPVSVTPEPAAMTLLAIGLVGVGGAGLRRRRKA